MKKEFTVSPLKRIVEPVERPEPPIPGQEYRQIGVQLWGRGAYEREPLDGGRTKYKTLSRVEKDDIIVNKIWARNGSVAVVPPGLAGCYASNEFPTFRPIPDHLEPGWFHWFTKTSSFWQQCDEKSRGTSGKNRIRPERFLEILLPLPSLTEQRRVVSRIEELSAKIEEARGLRGKSFQEADALMNAASTQAFSQLDNVGVRIVDEMCEVRGGIQKSIVRTPGANPRRYITVAHVQRNWIDTADPRYFEVSDAELERWRLLPGDVLVIEGNGSADQIGRAALFKGEIGDCVHQNHVIRVRPNSSLLLPEYLNTYFNSPVGRDQMLVRSRTTSGLFNLSVGRINNIEVPLPPISAQRRIVAYLDDLQAKVDALKRLQEDSAAELGALMPSILHRAFAGEL